MAKTTTDRKIANRIIYSKITWLTILTMRFFCLSLLIFFGLNFIIIFWTFTQSTSSSLKKLTLFWLMTCVDFLQFLSHGPYLQLPQAPQRRQKTWTKSCVSLTVFLQCLANFLDGDMNLSVRSKHNYKWHRCLGVIALKE